MKRSEGKLNQKKNRGFTLIELLAVIVILTIIAFIAVQNGRYCVTKGIEDKDVTISEDLDDCTMPVSYNIGDVVYYNPEINEMCSDYVESNSEFNVKSGCLKWIVYSTSGTNAKLVLDHDIETAGGGFNYDDYETEEAYNNAINESLNNQGLLFQESLYTQYGVEFLEINNPNILYVNENHILQELMELHSLQPSIEMNNGKVKVQDDKKPLIQELYVPESIAGPIYGTINIYDEMNILVSPANADKSKIRITLEDETVYSMDEFGNISIPNCVATEKNLIIETTDGSNITKTVSFRGNGCPS